MVLEPIRLSIRVKKITQSSCEVAYLLVFCGDAVTVSQGMELLPSIIRYYHRKKRKGTDWPGLNRSSAWSRFGMMLRLLYQFILGREYVLLIHNDLRQVYILLNLPYHR